LIRSISPSPHLQNLRNYFKDQLNSYDELHDTQVMMVEIEEVLDEFPEIEPFLAVLEKREKRLMREAEKIADQVKLESLNRKVASIYSEVEGLIDRQDELIEEALCAVDDAYSLVLHRVDSLKRNQVATIHRLRIAMKKFRYLIEIVYPVISGYPTETVGLMHDFQDVMGEIQDVEILLGSMTRYYHDHKQVTPESVKNYFEKVHSDDIELFYQKVVCVPTFWRKNSDSPYPWEENKTGCVSESVNEAEDKKGLATDHSK
jgi:CHAD domain-containing protein